MWEVCNSFVLRCTALQKNQARNHAVPYAKYSLCPLLGFSDFCFCEIYLVQCHLQPIPRAG